MAKTHPRTAYDKLNPMQKKFVNEYMIDFNAGRAYVRAGYAKQAADQCASRALNTAKVAAAVTEALDAIGISPNRIRSGIAAIAFGDEPSKRVTGPNAHNEQDRLAAMDRLSKIQGMITDHAEVTQVGPVRVMFDDGTPAQRAAAAGEAAAERRRAAEVNTRYCRSLPDDTP